MSNHRTYHTNRPGAGITLGEGNTPLVRSRFIGPSLGLSNLYFKLENLNPTGSYKDRFASRLISDMVKNGHRTCLATSSGNTGAALAAYSAAAGIPCIIVVVDGAPAGKLKQMQLYGAQLIMVRDFGKSAAVTSAVFESLQSLNTAKGLPLPVSAYCFCPEGMRGVETITHEIVQELEGPVEIFVPAGGGGLTLAVAKGMEASGRHGKVHCVQPDGNDTIATPLRERGQARAVTRSTTLVSGLQVANVLDGNEVIDACSSLGGTGFAVTDESIFKWHKALAMKEGIFCEPAGAVALAGLERAISMHEADPEATHVCLVTGSGFKDMASVDNRFSLPETVAVETDTAMSMLYQLVKECK